MVGVYLQRTKSIFDKLATAVDKPLIFIFSWVKRWIYIGTW